MPCGDGTGPPWIHYSGRNYWRYIGSKRDTRWRGRFSRCIDELVTLTKEEKRNLLEAELNEIEAERRAIELKLKELTK